jgi:hypothetical protein
VGSILRSAAAFGFGQVIALKGTAALWSPKVLRAGMGAHFGLRLIEGLDAEALEALQRAVVVTSSHQGELAAPPKLPRPCAWVLGHEGQGVGAHIGGQGPAGGAHRPAGRGRVAQRGRGCGHLPARQCHRSAIMRRGSANPVRYNQRLSKPSPAHSSPKFKARLSSRAVLERVWAYPSPSGEPSAFVPSGNRPTRHPGARRRHGLSRQFDRRRRLHHRRSGVQHRHHRLPGNPHRPQLLPADRDAHVSAHRQLRRQRGRHRSRQGPRRRPDHQGPAAAGQQLPLHHDACRSTWQREGTVAIANIDTRKLTRLLRSKGAQNGCIVGLAAGEAVTQAHIDKGHGRRQGRAQHGRPGPGQGGQS